jgi:hypothetical protein
MEIAVADEADERAYWIKETLTLPLSICGNLRTNELLSSSMG